MRFREPFELFTLIRLYNFSLVIINIILTWQSFSVLDYGLDLLRCHPHKFATIVDTARITDLYITTRVVEFLETFFFALRKKDNQISFLHVFHHTYVPAIGLYLSYDLTSPLILICISFNSFIHIVMYTYYTLATYESLKAFLWWKKHLTALQLVQFTLMMLVCIYQLVINRTKCQYMPYKVIITSFMTGFIFMILFINFYIQSYRQNKKLKSK